MTIQQDIDLTSEVLARANSISTSTRSTTAQRQCLICGIRANTSMPRRPSLVVLDLNLPRKDGRDVLAKMKAHPGAGQDSIVIFTTWRAS